MARPPEILTESLKPVLYIPEIPHLLKSDEQNISVQAAYGTLSQMASIAHEYGPARCSFLDLWLGELESSPLLGDNPYGTFYSRTYRMAPMHESFALWEAEEPQKIRDRYAQLTGALSMDDQVIQQSESQDDIVQATRTVGMADYILHRWLINDIGQNGILSSPEDFDRAFNQLTKAWRRRISSSNLYCQQIASHGYHRLIEEKQIIQQRF